MLNIISNNTNLESVVIDIDDYNEPNKPNPNNNLNKLEFIIDNLKKQITSAFDALHYLKLRIGFNSSIPNNLHCEYCDTV
jgi:hypothetical protein